MQSNPDAPEPSPNLGDDHTAEPTRITLSAEDWARFTSALDAPPQPNEALQRLARKYGSRAGRLSDAQRDELRRRLAENAANPGDVIPWEQIEAEALARFRRRGG